MKQTSSVTSDVRSSVEKFIHNRYAALAPAYWMDEAWFKLRDADPWHIVEREFLGICIMDEGYVYRDIAHELGER